MLFNSFEFIFIFLPCTFFIYFFLNKRRLTEVGKGFLVFSSLFFYSWWNIAYLPLILCSMLLNFVLGKQISEPNKKYSRKVILFIGILLNLSTLGYFKYTDFLIQNFNYISSIHIQPLNLVLPLAISFYTFQQIAYLVDSYKGETKEYDFLNYSLFVCFFPQLIAGPIVHHSEMMPQFSNLREKVKSYKNISIGLFIFSIGLFKKIIIADTFSIWATNGFDLSEHLSFFEAWATSLSYTFQLYFDFSGYTDMAIGIAFLFNIQLPLNFNSPYKSLDIQDFWRRWHMTLSRFMRDYIYIPLGGNRKGSYHTYNNLVMTFLIGGIWHGAGWTFVIWGALHGVALIINRKWKKTGIQLPSFIAWIVTFNFLNITWIFFRAKDFSHVVKILKGMFILQEPFFSTAVNFDPYQIVQRLYYIGFDIFRISVKGSYYLLIWFILALIIIVSKNSNELRQQFRPSVSTFIYTVALFIISCLFIQKNSEFLYFNF